MCVPIPATLRDQPNAERRLSRPCEAGRRGSAGSLVWGTATGTTWLWVARRDRLHMGIPLRELSDRRLNRRGRVSRPSPCGTVKLDSGQEKGRSRKAASLAIRPPKLLSGANGGTLATDLQESTTPQHVGVVWLGQMSHTRPMTTTEDNKSTRALPENSSMLSSPRGTSGRSIVS
jgi:hypothetical protein